MLAAETGDYKMLKLFVQIENENIKINITGTKQEIETLSISEKILKTIYNPDNKGYAKANNQGIFLAKHEFREKTGIPA